MENGSFAVILGGVSSERLINGTFLEPLVLEFLSDLMRFKPSTGTSSLKLSAKKANFLIILFH